jgi:glycosyltransferase involved in cell wall biosynthesis
LYAASSIYWHSSGLGVDPTVEPERCEHFGIAPIEAMAHGTIPVVVNNGGPAATVRDGIDGYHYDSVEGLAARTAELLSRTEDELRPMREMARSRAQQFSREAFGEALASTFDW